MKKMFEGSSVISAVLLILGAVGAFIFNIKTQKNKIKYRRHEEKKVEEAERNKDYSFERSKAEMEKERAENIEELERLRKLNDPLWNYFDPDKSEYIVLPGKYGLDEPGNRP